MKTGYNLKGYHTSKASFYKRIRERLSLIKKIVFAKSFIYIAVNDRDNDNLEVDIVNYNNSSETTLQVLKNYKAVTEEKIKHQKAIQKLTAWLPSNN